MREIYIELFKEIRSCQDCLYSWDGFSSGFARGHSILVKNNLLIFISDDINYQFPNNENINLDQIFRLEGFISLDECPKCKSKKLFPEINDNESKTDVKIYDVEFSDFYKKDDKWYIRQEIKDKLRDYT
jgi:hypothetical protein